MSIKTVLAIALLAGAAATASAATPHTVNAACTAHVKKMKEMKTSAERTAYCKANEECASHQCTKEMTHHKAAAKK